MTRKTRERIERLENRVTEEETINSTLRKICQDGFANVEARLSALEDSLEAAELKIEQRKAENVYLNRLLDMLQHGIVQKGGEAPAETPKADVEPPLTTAEEERVNSWSE